MKTQFNITSWTQNITTPSTRDQFGNILTQPSGTTTFTVDLTSDDMDYVANFIGTTQVTLNYLTSHTQQAETDVGNILLSEGKVTTIKELDTLTEAKRARYNRILAIRDGLEGKGFTYLGKPFDSDQRSLNRINTAAQAAFGAAITNTDFTLTWTCADNTTIDLTRDQIIGLPAALAQHANDLHLTAKTLKSQIDAATTIDQVNAVKWPNVES